LTARAFPLRAGADTFGPTEGDVDEGDELDIVVHYKCTAKSTKPLVLSMTLPMMRREEPAAGAIDAQFTQIGSTNFSWQKVCGNGVHIGVRISAGTASVVEKGISTVNWSPEG
jgi:hypothetical protein